MATIWLDNTTYPSVRAAISPTLTLAELPDAILALPIYTGVAEMAIKGLDTDWQLHNADADKFAALQFAAIYWVASLALIMIPSVNQESFGRNDYAYQADVLTPTQLAGILRARASAIVLAVTNDTIEQQLPTFFAVAHGTRSRDLSALGPIELPDNSIILGIP